MIIIIMRTTMKHAAKKFEAIEKTFASMAH
jgi:hypothetical protein